MTILFFYGLLLIIAVLAFINWKLRQENVNLTAMVILAKQEGSTDVVCDNLSALGIKGTFLARPSVDVEVFDTNDETVGQGTTELVVKIYSKGVLLHGTVTCVIPQAAMVAGFCLWIGDQRHKVYVPPQRSEKGSIVCLDFSYPIDMQQATASADGV